MGKVKNAGQGQGGLQLGPTQGDTRTHFWSPRRLSPAHSRLAATVVLTAVSFFTLGLVFSGLMQGRAIPQPVNLGSDTGLPTDKAAPHGGSLAPPDRYLFSPGPPFTWQALYQPWRRPKTDFSKSNRVRDDITVWPMPYAVRRGFEVLAVSPKLKVILSGDISEASNALLRRAVDRCLDTIFEGFVRESPMRRRLLGESSGRRPQRHVEAPHESKPALRRRVLEGRSGRDEAGAGQQEGSVMRKREQTKANARSARSLQEESVEEGAKEIEIMATSSNGDEAEVGQGEFIPTQASSQDRMLRKLNKGEQAEEGQGGGSPEQASPQGSNSLVTESGTEGSREAQALQALEINILSANHSLFFGVDETYILYAPYNNTLTAFIQARTVYGAFRALETFSQLCEYDYGRHTTVIPQAPWAIKDKPRFHHRGLLLDTARHFEPLSVMETVLDSMAYAKLNVLHWHMVDEQSFPIEIPSFPRLWEGSYTAHERYTVGDMKHIVRYAAERGILIVPEIDVPGHAAAWGRGYSQLWPADNCQMPLDVSSNATFDVIEGIMSDLAKIIPYGVMHLGGDEVNTDCWLTVEHVNKWLTSHSMSPRDAYAYFVNKARSIAERHGWKTVTLWEETFGNFGQTLDDQVTVQLWLRREMKQDIVDAGRRLIVSLVGEWYLDHPEHPWWNTYSLDPCSDIPDKQCDALVIGGEVCMWSEHVDPSNVISRIWPRAAAAAERLWSSRNYTSNAPREAVRNRMKDFRCLMHRRGIGANYIDQDGWAGELQPNSCYLER